MCPTCEGRLKLESFGSADGVLFCDRCLVWSPLAAGVPVLLDFATPFHGRFARERVPSGLLDGYRLPTGTPRPGELSVQETFTEEWDRVRASDLSFTYSAADLERLNREVWLKWLPRADGERPIRRVLDVGCGAGAEAIALARVTGAEVVGVDLNFALLRSDAVRRAEAGVHFVVASVFALPFARASFDLVYSQGVLHHTYSTRAAFEAAAAQVADGGYLFVWLYGREDHLALHGRRGAATRVGIGVERLLRPLLSRSGPRVRDAFFGAATAVAHPILKPRLQHADSWERENTDHYLRDWLSPPFAHRHGWNEVVEWFEGLGFEIVDVQSPRRYRELFRDPLWGVGLTGRRR